MKGIRVTHIYIQRKKGRETHTEGESERENWIVK